MYPEQLSRPELGFQSYLARVGEEVLEIAERKRSERGVLLDFWEAVRDDLTCHVV
jgi:hypothetical protein